VDLAFSDGTSLHNLGAVDQHGYALDAADQGRSRSLYVNQWNHVSSAVGSVAAGKTITEIRVDYDNPQAATPTTAFQGWLDDIQLLEPSQQSIGRLSDYVNTTRGSANGSSFSRGYVFPAAATPHGFNFLTPMTDAQSTSFFYNYSSDNDSNNLPSLQALAISHSPTPGLGDRNVFEVMPAEQGLSTQPIVSSAGRALEFTHDHESARPYAYGVTLNDGINAEMAPTDHGGMFRFTFLSSQSSLIFDQPNNAGSTVVETSGPLGVPDGVVSGYSDVASKVSAGTSRMFWFAKLLLAPGQSILRGGTPNSTSGAGGPAVTRYMTVDTSAAKTVTMEFATSLISLAQAQHNLGLEISGADTFNTIRARAQTAWDKALGVITVAGASPDELTTLYSNLYRLNLYPNEGYENVGTKERPQYVYASPVSAPSGAATPTHTNARIVAGTMYNNNGFWDTNRTVWPLDSLLYPSETGQMIQGFVQQYLDGGWIARWSSPGYTNDMTGTGADDAFTDAYVNGVRNFNYRGLYAAAVKDATVYSASLATGRNGLETSPFLGFTSTSTRFGLSWALAGYTSDYGIAQMSQALCTDRTLLNDPQHGEFCANQMYFAARAQQYVNVWDGSLYDPALGASSSPKGFFLGKNDAGAFRLSPSQYDPQVWGTDYTEADGWTTAFSAPQDPQGLAALMGGPPALAERLDQYFSIPELGNKPGAYGHVFHELLEASQVQIGQYEFNNEPAFAIPYLYDAAGQPSKAEAIVRETLARMFVGSEVGQGYPGDEDNGAMSSWYILSALGFYPESVGGTDMAIGSPLFAQATVHLENGHTLVVNAKNNGMHNVYVQGLTVNGSSWDKTYLPRSLLAAGGVIDFTMGSRPSQWGTAAGDALSTMTPTGAGIPRPLHDLAAQGTGTASGSAGSSSAVGALFDDTSGTQITFNGPAVGTPSSYPWVQYQFGAPQTVVMYTLTSGKDPNGAMPTAWTLSGSNDGRVWTTIDQHSNESFLWPLQTRPFAVATAAAYLYYRLQVSASSRASSTTLAEMELLGAG
jgi:predicted alpha-1,2-mannosidase